jgi:hypothetical protein
VLWGMTLILSTKETRRNIAVSALVFVRLTRLSRGPFKATATDSPARAPLIRSSPPRRLYLLELLAQFPATRTPTTQLLRLQEELSSRTKEASSSRYAQFPIEAAL